MTDRRDSIEHRTAAWLRDHVRSHAGEEFPEIERVDFSGEDLGSVEFEMIYRLSGCVFDRASLCGIHAPTYIFKCSFIEAQLDDTWLAKSQFHRCDLRAASLSDAKLSRTDFARSDLRGARFSGDELFNEVSFHRCDLREARLTGLRFRAVSFGGSSLSGIDLSQTTGSIFPEPINVGSPEEPRLLEGDEALNWFEGAGARNLSYVPLVER